MGFYVRLDYEIDRVYRTHRNSNDYRWRTWWSSCVVSEILDTLDIKEHNAHITYSHKTDRKERGYSKGVTDSNTHRLELNIWVSDETATFLELKHPSIMLWHDSHANAFVYGYIESNATIKRTKHGIKIEHNWHVPANKEEDYTLEA